MFFNGLIFLCTVTVGLVAFCHSALVTLDTAQDLIQYSGQVAGVTYQEDLTDLVSGPLNLTLSDSIDNDTSTLGIWALVSAASDPSWTTSMTFSLNIPLNTLEGIVVSYYSNQAATLEVSKVRSLREVILLPATATGGTWAESANLTIQTNFKGSDKLQIKLSLNSPMEKDFFFLDSIHLYLTSTYKDDCRPAHQNTFTPSNTPGEYFYCDFNEVYNQWILHRFKCESVEKKQYVFCGKPILECRETCPTTAA